MPLVQTWPAPQKNGEQEIVPFATAQRDPANAAASSPDTVGKTAPPYSPNDTHTPPPTGAPFDAAQSSQKALFACRRCGHCCHGTGGIVVGPRDLPRLCTFLGLSEQEFLAGHTIYLGGKPMLHTGEDGYCAFFKAGIGCAIHPARPDVCRAWPYFRGNLVDSISFRMAQEDCPGIAPHAIHADFAHEGYAYLHDNNMLATDPACEARALIIHSNELPPHAHGGKTMPGNVSGHDAHDGSEAP